MTSVCQSPAVYLLSNWDLDDACPPRVIPIRNAMDAKREFLRRIDDLRHAGYRESGGRNGGDFVCQTMQKGQHFVQVRCELEVVM